MSPRTRAGFQTLSAGEVSEFFFLRWIDWKERNLAVDLDANIPFPYPIIDDEQRELAVKFQMLDKDEIGKSGLPLTCRAVFIVDGTKKLRAKILYPATTGRNFE